MREIFEDNMNKEEQIKELKKAHAKILRQIKAFSKATSEFEDMARDIMGVYDIDMMWASDINNGFILAALFGASPKVVETEYCEISGRHLGLEDLIEKIKEGGQ